jgi:hypothetical protein
VAAQEPCVLVSSRRRPAQAGPMPRIELPSSLSARPFSVAEGVRAGLGRERLRSGDLARPHHGVRSPVEAMRGDRVDDRARLFLPAMRPGWCFSHLTALAMPSAPARDHDAVLLHVSVPAGRGPRRHGIVGHRGLDAGAVRRVAGLPVVDPLTAFVQAGPLLPLDALVAVADALCGSWSPWPEARERSPADLETQLAAAGQVRGASAVRRALQHVRVGVESPKETELRLLLIRSGLPEPEVNQATYDEAGRYLGKPDLRFPDERVSVEYEGDEHRRDPARWRRDIRRRERFADAGWRTVRVPEADLQGRPARELIERVRRALSG